MTASHDVASTTNDQPAASAQGTAPDEVAACCGTDAVGLDQAEAERLAVKLGAVADPVRLQVLSILANADEVCACDFVGPIGKSQPTVSHHLKVLTESGLITGERRGRWIWYRLADDGIAGLTSALADATTATR